MKKWKSLHEKEDSFWKFSFWLSQKDLLFLQDMKRLILVIPAFYSGIIQPGSLSSSCSLDGNVQVDFSYEPADTDLDYAYVGAADSTSCGLGSGQVVLTKIDESDGTWRITYEPDWHHFHVGDDNCE